MKLIKLLKLIKEKIIKLFKKEIIAIESKTFESTIDIQDQEQKKEFFELYENVKSGKVKKEQLLITDLIKVQMMMEQERKIYNEKIELEEKEIKKLDKQIDKLKSDKKRLSSQI